jgi:hypothetical protein
MALADIYQLIHRQDFIGKLVENVYFFRREDSSVDHQDLQDGFVDQYLNDILTIQCAVVKSTEILVQSLGNTSDFGSTPLTATEGLRSGDCLPAFNAVGYTFRSADRAVRPGSKRICGVPEAVTLYDDITDASYLGYMETLRVTLDTPITFGGGIFTPVLVKRIKEPIVGTVPPQYTYRLPETGDPLTVATFLGVLVGKKVTSQISRKH